MKTMLIRLPMAASDTSDSAGAAPAADTNGPESGTSEPQPETTAPAAEPASGGGEPDPSVNDQAGASPAADSVESDDSFEARMKERREAREKLRAETPHQVVELKAQAGSSHLGVIIQGADGATRVHPLCDWRQDLVHLQAGDTLTVVVLVGEEREAYLTFAKREQALKDQPAQAGDVKTASLDAAAATSILGAAVPKIA